MLLRKANLKRTLPTLPDKELYAYRSLTTPAKAKFEKWYDENYNTEFSLAESLASYCTNDVTYC